ncbi:MAG: hypothetical protein IT236_10285 [Bacteroidia bacterium]|nr:hypothetical protein [Bacteroidia bacterium]
MKKIIIIALMLTNATYDAQIFSGSAKGQSSILYQGTTLGFNFTDPSIGFSLNNYSNEKYKRKNKHFLLGVNTSASASEGYANFFSGGDLNGEIKANAIIGRTWTKGENNKIGYRIKSLNDLILEDVATASNDVRAALTAISAQLTTLYTTEINQKYPAANDQKKNQKILADLKNFVDNLTAKGFEEEYQTEVLDKNPADVEYLLELKDKLKTLFFDRYLESRSTVQNLTQAKNRLFESRGYWKHRFSIYVAPNYVSKAFKLYTLDNSNLANSFSSKTFAGGGVNLGLNWNIGTCLLVGINGGYLRDNNSDELTSKDYNLTNTYTVAVTGGTQQLVSDKKITAKSGSYYHALDLYPLNADIVGFMKVPGNDSTIIAFNLYLHQMFSGMKTQRPQTTNIGLGIYFFSNKASKFLGGIYFEAPDIKNNIAKNDPEASIRPLYKRLTFGLTGKFAFSSLTSLFN